MRRSRKTPLIAGVVATVGLGGTALAFAGGWTMDDGRATVTLSAAKMPKGAAPSVAKQGKTAAVVSWSAQEIVSGVKMDHYVVTAHSVDEPPLADVVHTVAASGGDAESLTFAANEVAGGKWYWTIVPKFHLWAGAESGKSQKLTFPAAPATALVSADSTADPAADPAGRAAPTASPQATPTTVVAPATSPAAPPAVTATTKPAPAVEPTTTEAKPVEAVTTAPAAAPTSSGTDDSVAPPAPPAAAESAE
jgi:hypothetical protein